MQKNIICEMKHLKLYENNSLQVVRKLLKEYDNFVTNIRPYVINKYNKLAKNKNYYPHIGEKPYEIDEGDLFITHFLDDENGLEFILTSEITDKLNDEFYIFLSDKELEKAFIEMDANKYNL